jgi:LPS export ABC transporter protein LptC
MKSWGMVGGIAVLVAAACSNQGIKPMTATAVADSADQVILKMATNIASEGVRKSFVVAETAYVYQLTQKMDLRQLRATFFDAQGKQSSVLTAKTGLYTMNTGSLDARGNVVVETVDGRKLTTEHLIYDRNANQVRSDTAFVFDSKNEHIIGNEFVSDPDFKNVTVNQPKGHERGKGTLLPGQKP